MCGSTPTISIFKTGGPTTLRLGSINSLIGALPKGTSPDRSGKLLRPRLGLRTSVTFGDAKWIDLLAHNTETGRSGIAKVFPAHGSDAPPKESESPRQSQRAVR